MHHDPALGRTFVGTGLIAECRYHGYIDRMISLQEPHLPVPLFGQVIELLMEPAYRHATFNIDVKPQNDPERLFFQLHKIISSYPNFEKDLLPRLVFGFWHPKHLDVAVRFFPSVRRTHIGSSPKVAQELFWDHVEGFSMFYFSLMTPDGQRFCRKCKAANKLLMVYHAETPESWARSIKSGVAVIITDRIESYVAWRAKIKTRKHNEISRIGSAYNPFSTWRSKAAVAKDRWQMDMLKSCEVSTVPLTIVTSFDKAKALSSEQITPLHAQF
jgi:hypothetical protein